MSILMAVIGATIGATIGSLFMHWRKDVAKERQQLETKTPYDYALTNAINERDRLQDELRTIQALKRTEADTERIRNEIGTILSDVGEEAAEDVYDPDKVYRELEGVTKRWESNMKELTGGWDIPDVINTSDYGIERLKAERVVYTTLNADDYGEHIPIQKHDDGTVSPILPHAGELDTSPMAAVTGMSAAESGWDAAAVSRAYARLGGNVREFEHVVTSGETLTTIARKYGVKIWDIVKDNDILIYDDLNETGVIFVGQRLKIRDNGREFDTKDEQSSEDGVERSYLELIDKAIYNEQKVLCIYRNPTGEGLNGIDLVAGTIVNFRYHNGQTRYLTLRVRHTHKGGTYITHISGEYLDEVSLIGGESHGEIIYRKETI